MTTPDLATESAADAARSRAEAALRESEARYSSALTAGRMGAWETDFVHGTRQWTKEGLALFGLDLPDGRGRVGGDDDEYMRALHPDDRHLTQHFHEISARQDSFPADYRIVRPDGSMLWLSGRGLVVARGADGKAQRLVSIMADVTDRKRVDDALRIERERLALALSAGQMGAFELGMVDGVLWWSPQTYVIFGVDPGTFTPTTETVLACVHPDDREAFMAHRREAMAEHRPFFLEFRIVRPDGTVAWLGHRGQSEYDAAGRPLRSFGVTMDITDRKLAEQALREADREKDEFIATLAHELRNPLAPIRNAVDVLGRLDGPGKQADWCRAVIDRQVEQMAHLLDDLLDVSRLARGQIRLRLRPLQLATAIAQAIETAQPLIDRERHTLSVTLPAEPMALEGDLTRLAQVFSNLLINAAKYTPPEGRIGVTARREDGCAVVTVSDSGIGIAGERMSHVFKMFGQVESALERSQGGLGIGLSLARALVELHGGSIEAHSEGVGRGSDFVVRLPLLALEAGPGVEKGNGDGEAVSPSAEPFRVLVVDDLRDSADTLALLLDAMGHGVRVAYDGRQALQLADLFRPQVVLLDLRMPGLNGYDICRRLRALPGGDEITIIAQTGWGQDEDRRRTREAGFDHHLVKPVELASLISLFPRRDG